MSLNTLEACLADIIATPDDMDGYLARMVREEYASNARGLFGPAQEALAGAIRNDTGAHAACELDHGTSTSWRICRFGVYDALLVEVIHAQGYAAYLFILDAPE